VEAYSGSHMPSDNQRAFEICRNLGVCTSGGSDAHALMDLGRFMTKFSAPINRQTDLVEAIRAVDMVPVKGSS
jgi:hypothetical protein